MTDYVLTADGTTPPIFVSLGESVQNISVITAVSTTDTPNFDYEIEVAYQTPYAWAADNRMSSYASEVGWFTFATETTTPATIVRPSTSAVAAFRLVVTAHVSGQIAIQVLQVGPGWNGGATAAEVLAVLNA